MLTALRGSEGIQEETALPLLMVPRARAKHRCVNRRGDKSVWKQGGVSGRDSGKLLLDLRSEIDKCLLWKQALESGGGGIIKECFFPINIFLWFFTC